MDDRTRVLPTDSLVGAVPCTNSLPTRNGSSSTQQQQQQQQQQPPLYTVQHQGRSLLVPRVVVMGNEVSGLLPESHRSEVVNNNNNNNSMSKRTTAAGEQSQQQQQQQPTQERPLSNLSVLMMQQEQQRGGADVDTRREATAAAAVVDATGATVDEADCACGRPASVTATNTAGGRTRFHLGSSAPTSTTSTTTTTTTTTTTNRVIRGGVPITVAPPPALHRHVSVGTMRARRYGYKTHDGVCIESYRVLSLILFFFFFFDTIVC